MRKRRLEIVVLSDIGLGTSACRAAELLGYLASIQTTKLIIYGPFLNRSHLDTSDLPHEQFLVLQKFAEMAENGTQIHHIHNGQYPFPISANNPLKSYLQPCDELTLNLDGRKTWFWAGDQTQLSTRLGFLMAKSGRPFRRLFTKIRWSISRKRESMGTTVTHEKIARHEEIGKKPTDHRVFKERAIAIALAEQNDTLVSGLGYHALKESGTYKGTNCTFLSAGQWSTGASALEYSFKRWKIYRYENDKLSPFYMDEALKQMDLHTLMARVRDKKFARS